MATPSRSRRALVAAATLFGLLVAVPQTASAVPAPADWSASDLAATWIAGEHRTDDGSWAPGAYADVVLGLAAADGDRAAAVAALDDLEALVEDWVHPTATTTDPAAAAKAMLAVHALQGDPHEFGGIDLEAALRSTMRTDTNAADPGRFGSVTVFGQSLAVLALSQAGGGVPDQAQQWLRGRQCEDGGFSPTSSCAGADADHTALAAQALRIFGEAGAREAGAWLVGHQAGDGGFGAGSNANSTALAAQALRAVGRTAEADLATARIRALQKSTGDDTGAIAFRADEDGDLLFATTQGVLAFGAPRLDLVRFPDVIGEPCAAGSGVTVVVDLALFDGTVRVGCSTADAPTGSDALETAGFDVTFQTFTFGRFVCSIENAPAQPSEGQACGGPAGTGYWGYWQAASHGAPWVASASGSDDTRPTAGSVEGWRYDPDFNTASLEPRAATSWSTAALAGPGSTPIKTPTGYDVEVTRAGIAVVDGLVQLLRGGLPFGAPVSVDDSGVTTIEVVFAEPGDAVLSVRYLGSPTHNPRSSAPIPVTAFIGSGYWVVRSRGTVDAVGAVPHRGDLLTNLPASKVVGMASRSSGAGYWIATERGDVSAFGDAAVHGTLNGVALNKPIVGIARTPGGLGYWLVASDGGVFAFGDAGFFGSAGSLPLNKPIVGILPTPSGRGYLLAASDGGVFAYGDAEFGGSLGNLRLNKPVVGIAAEPDRPGYILVASDGGVFALGGAKFHGSAGGISLNEPVVAASAVAGGYRLLAADGGIFSYDVPFLGAAPCTIPVASSDGRISCGVGAAVGITSH